MNKKNSCDLTSKYEEYLQLCSTYSIPLDRSLIGIDQNIVNQDEAVYKYNIVVDKIEHITKLIHRKKDAAKDILNSILTTANHTHKINSKFYNYLVDLCVTYSPNTSLSECYRKISAVYGVTPKAVLESILHNLNLYNDIIPFFFPDYIPTKSNKVSMSNFMNCMYFYIEKKM